MNIIHLANLISVGVFDMVLSAEFCDIRWTRKKQLFMVAVMAAIMFLFLMHFSARQVRALSHYPWKIQCQFGLVPALYYCFDYMTRIYTNLILEGGLIVAEFMPFVCSVAYLVFVYHTSEEGRIRDRLEQTQDSLNLQVTQAVREIEALREAQRKTRAYHHDMRGSIHDNLCISAGGYATLFYMERTSRKPDSLLNLPTACAVTIPPGWTDGKVQVNT